MDLNAALAWAAAHPLHGEDNVFHAFAEKMRRDPEMFWAAIADGRFGIQSADLGNVWIETLALIHPEVLIGHFMDMPAGGRSRVVQQCFDVSRIPDEEFRTKLLALVIELEDTPANRLLWRFVGSVTTEQNSADLLATIQTATRPGERWMAAEAFARSLVTSPTDAAGMRAQYDQLPDELKTLVIPRLIEGTRDMESLRLIEGILIEQDRWADVRYIGLNHHPSALPTGESATAAMEWAIQLPQRLETADLYRTSLQGWLADHPDERTDWIANLPNPWQRDNALMSAMDTALGLGDADTADWALGQIQDKSIHDDASRSRQSWHPRLRRQ